MVSRLEFKTSVLGNKAADRLRNVRGRFLTFRSRLPKYSELDVYLDDELLGKATIKRMPTTKANLAVIRNNPRINAQGGFTSEREQEAALKRAGYRFRPLEQYNAYMIVFFAEWGNRTYMSWTGEEEVEEDEEEPHTGPEGGEPEKETKTMVQRRNVLLNEILELEKRKAELVTGIEELEMAAAQLERLRVQIADRIDAPRSLMGDMRIWQLRVATKIIDLIRPYIRLVKVKLEPGENKK